MKKVAKFNYYCFLPVLLAGLFLSPVFANENELEASQNLIDKRWKFKGFGTLGYAQTDKYDNTYFRRDISQDAVRIHDNPFLIDSRIGLQLTGELSDHWEVVLQTVLKQKIETKISDYINIAFARYTSSTNWQLTLGRQPFDLFLLSENRNVGYSYDWVRPPVEFYGVLPSDSFDGLKVSKTWGGFDHDWYWHASIGKIDEGFQLTVPTDNNPFPDEIGPIGNIRGVESTQIEPIYTTGVAWVSNHWQLNAGISWMEIEQQLDFESDFSILVDGFSSLWPDIINIGDQLLGKNTIRYYSLGAKWEKGPWKFQSEVSHVDADRASYNGQRAYFSLSRRFDEWLGFAMLGFAHDGSSITYQPVSELELPDDPFIQSILFATQSEIDNRLAALKQNQSSITVGVRWDFTREKALKAQCENYWFEAGSNALIDRVNGNYLKDQRQAWCSFSFDWVF